MKKNGISLKFLPPFQTGQVWQMEDANILIGLVGKLFVHYRHYRIQQPRVPTSLSTKRELEKFLKTNKAVLGQCITIADKKTGLLSQGMTARARGISIYK